MAETLSIALVEDHAATRQRLVRQLQALSGYRVSAACESVAEIRAYLANDCPAVLLVDLGLPDGDGCELISEAVAQYPALPIMVISVFGDQDRVVRAIRSGAKGYIQKDDDSKSIGSAIRQLLDGGSPISPAIARQLIRQFAADDVPGPESCETLSPREQEVLNLAARGYTYQETADLLGVTINTVGSHTKQIYAKLAVNSRAQAVFEAARLGLVNVRAD